MGGRGMQSGDFKLTGFSSDTAVDHATNGKFTMSSGKVFGYDKVSAGQIIISKALAQFNGIAVGDTITVANATDSTKTYKLTVAGIYTNTSAAGGTSGGMGNAADPDNAIYTSMATLDSLSLSSASTGESPEMQLNFTYVVSDKAGYAAFAKDVKAAGLSSDYTVSSPDVEEYEASLVPLDNLAKFALTLLLIVLGVGGAVLVALNVFNIRERKYEVGVLTAIGVRKGQSGRAVRVRAAYRDHGRSGAWRCGGSGRLGAGFQPSAGKPSGRAAKPAGYSVGAVRARHAGRRHAVRQPRPDRFAARRGLECTGSFDNRTL
jgi:putative ABC transport system permease protein